MPSITKLQKLIENAWNNGFDVAGKAQLGGSLEATSKWIGASDVCAMFSSLRIKYFRFSFKLNKPLNLLINFSK